MFTRRKFHNNLIIYLMLISIVTMEMSCINKSQASQPKNYAIEGLYIGTYIFDPRIADANKEPQYFSFIIKPGGELSVESIANGQEYYARGKWNLAGSTLHCSYRYTNSVTGEELEQIALADFSIKGKLIDGKWHNKYTPGMKGSFSMIRIN
ncbi:MAG: hypothetical protein ACXWV0_03745 [Flavisolibacter sp.]